MCEGLLCAARTQELFMKVILLIDHLGAGGAQRQLAGLACMLKERGVDVSVFTYYPIMFYEEILRQHHVPCDVIEEAGNHRRRFFCLRKKLLAAQPDWVVAYLDTPCIMASLIRWAGGKFRLIVSERNTTQLLTRRERLKFWLYRKADFIVPNSYSQGNFVCKHFPQYKAKTVVIPNFVDLDKFVCTTERHRRQPAVMLVVASIWASKNTKGFIDAVRLLRQRRDDFVVKWFGLNPNTPVLQNRVYMEECQRKVKEYGLEDTVFLYPKTKQIAEEYRKADYFCLPSFYEGTPNVLCEAMASSLPVICSRVCDNPQYVSEGENGFLFDPHNVQDMAAKLNAALQLNEVQHASYGRRSRAIAEEKMSEQVFTDRYMSLLREPRDGQTE